MAIIKCSECGKEISDKATSCIHCGCPVEKKITCSECGKEINDTASSCSYCGCPVEKINNGVESEQIIRNTTSSGYKLKIKKNFKWIIIVSIIIFLLIVILSQYNNSNIYGTYKCNKGVLELYRDGKCSYEPDNTIDIFNDYIDCSYVVTYDNTIEVEYTRVHTDNNFDKVSYPSKITFKILEDGNLECYDKIWVKQ